MSPATVEYARELGAGGIHIGILSALPTGMLFTQFITAWMISRLRYRRKMWICVSLLQRTIYLPVALGPWLIPGVPDSVWLWCLLAAAASNYGLLHYCSPLWLSWMGDYLPPQGLNKYWAKRQLWMQWTAAGVLGLTALVMFRSGLPIRTTFTGLLCLASIAGIADVLCFLRVEEPPVPVTPVGGLWKSWAAPFQDRRFRTYIGFSCFWHFAAMLGAPFISLFLLSYVKMDLFHVLLLWSLSWVGGAVVSHAIGNFADLHGNRPLLVLCMAFKSLNMLALLILPPNPTLAFWWLVPVLMVDAMLNAGIENANKGYMLLNSPTQHRTVYIAAGTAIAGLIGCVTSISAGGLLTAWEGWRQTVSTPWGPWLLTNFHLVFGLSFLMRLAAVHLARQIEEPSANLTRDALRHTLGWTVPTIITSDLPAEVVLKEPLLLSLSSPDTEVADAAERRVVPSAA